MKKLIVILVLTFLCVLGSTNFLSANDTHEPEKLVMFELPEGLNDVYVYGYGTLEEAEGMKVVKEVEPLEVTSPLTGEVIIEKCPICGHEL